MPKKRRDVIDDEVRRRLADILSDGGMPTGKLSLEMLYLLPTEAVRLYSQLFWLALREDRAAPGGPGSGPDAQAVKAPTRSEGVGARLMHLSSTGKRFKRHWLVKSEEALRLKRLVDRKFVRALEAAHRELRAQRTGSNPGGETGGKVQIDQNGSKSDESDIGSDAYDATLADSRDRTLSERGFIQRGRLEDLDIRCRQCGRIMMPDWEQCPWHL